MSFVSVTDREILESATETVLKALRSKKNTVFKSRQIVFRPNQAIEDVVWLPRYGVWFAVRQRRDHFWIPFGVSDPSQRRPLRISVELNTPRQSGHGRAGLILQDERGELYLAHTGRVGGGSPGISRTTFLKYRGPTRSDIVEYDNDRLAILIGRVSDKGIPSRIVKFVDEVAKFKTRSGDVAIPEAVSQSDRGLKFRPKFIGSVKRRAVGGQQVRLLHDLVCEAINDQLPSKGGRYSKRRDLYLPGDGGSIAVLFEVKTDSSLTSIYTGVGQLLLNGLGVTVRPRRLVLVIPGRPDSKTASVLGTLGIDVLPFRWSRGVPEFSQGAIARLLAD